MVMMSATKRNFKMLVKINLFFTEKLAIVRPHLCPKLRTTFSVQIGSIIIIIIIIILFLARFFTIPFPLGMETIQGEGGQ